MAQDIERTTAKIINLPSGTNLVYKKISEITRTIRDRVGLGRHGLRGTVFIH
jgi:hypothetical protein